MSASPGKGKIFKPIVNQNSKVDSQGLDGKNPKGSKSQNWNDDEADAGSDTGNVQNLDPGMPVPVGSGVDLDIPVPLGSEVDVSLRTPSRSERDFFELDIENQNALTPNLNVPGGDSPDPDRNFTKNYQTVADTEISVSPDVGRLDSGEPREIMKSNYQKKPKNPKTGVVTNPKDTSKNPLRQSGDYSNTKPKNKLKPTPKKPEIDGKKPKNKRKNLEIIGSANENQANRVLDDFDPLFNEKTNQPENSRPGRPSRADGLKETDPLSNPKDTSFNLNQGGPNRNVDILVMGGSGEDSTIIYNTSDGEPGMPGSGGVRDKSGNYKFSPDREKSIGYQGYPNNVAISPSDKPFGKISESPGPNETSSDDGSRQGRGDDGSRQGRGDDGSRPGRGDDGSRPGRGEKVRSRSPNGDRVRGIDLDVPINNDRSEDDMGDEYDFFKEEAADADESSPDLSPAKERLISPAKEGPNSSPGRGTNERSGCVKLSPGRPIKKKQRDPDASPAKEGPNSSPDRGTNERGGGVKLSPGRPTKKKQRDSDASPAKEGLNSSPGRGTNERDIRVKFSPERLTKKKTISPGRKVSKPH